jgi:hypothetical protein
LEQLVGRDARRELKEALAHVLGHLYCLPFSANAIVEDMSMISIFSNKLSIHITLRRFHKHIRWINGTMHNLATGAILIKMSGILALGVIQPTFFHENGLLINKSTFVLLGNM